MSNKNWGDRLPTSKAVNMCMFALFMGFVPIAFYRLSNEQSLVFLCFSDFQLQRYVVYF